MLADLGRMAETVTDPAINLALALASSRGALGLVEADGSIGYLYRDELEKSYCAARPMLSKQEILTGFKGSANDLLDWLAGEQGGQLPVSLSTLCVRYPPNSQPRCACALPAAGCRRLLCCLSSSLGCATLTPACGANG